MILELLNKENGRGGGGGGYLAGFRNGQHYEHMW